MLSFVVDPGDFLEWFSYRIGRLMQEPGFGSSGGRQAATLSV